MPRFTQNITNSIHSLYLCVLYASRNKQLLFLGVISGFNREVAENCTLLGS